MIPSINGFLSTDFSIKEQTSRTYQMELSKQYIKGMADKIEAMKQLIFKILNTERYQYAIYSWNFGVELADLFGKPISFVLPEIKRRIQEALTADSRILSVDNFDFEVSKGKVLTRFTAYTTFGEVEAGKEVNF